MLRLIAALLVFCVGCHVHACQGDSEPRGKLVELGRTRVAADETPEHAAIDPEGGRVLIGMARGPIHIWTLKAQAERQSFQPQADWPINEPLAAVRWVAPDTLLIAPESGRVHIDSVAKRAAQLEHNFNARSRFAELSQDGRYLAFGGSVLDRQQRQLSGTPVTVAVQSALAFSNNSQRVVVAGLQDETLIVRDLPSGATRSFFAADKVLAAAMSPDARLVVAAVRGGDVQMWTQPEGKLVRSLRGPEAARRLFFAANGARVVVAHEGGVCAFSAKDGEELYFSKVETRLVTFAVDGDVLAAASVAGDVVVWDVARGALLARAKLGSEPVRALAVSSGGRMALAADSAGEVALWRL